MYYRTDMTHRVNWEPTHTDLARRAMEEVVSDFTAETEPPVEVDPETAREVKARYRELVKADDEKQLGP